LKHNSLIKKKKYYTQNTCALILPSITFFHIFSYF
jgi:hypothetical protein